MQKAPATRRVESYRELDAWKKGMRLASAIYKATRYWPPEERYGLTSQIRRAAVSIPSNVAEGQGRLGGAELRHHLSIAHGSLCEVETLLYLAGDIGILEQDVLRSLLEDSAEVGKILRGFIRSLDGRGSSTAGRPHRSSSRHLDTSPSRLTD